MGTDSRGATELRRSLTVTERTALERRNSGLCSALAPWPEVSRDPLEAQVSLMLNFPANRGLDETAARGMVAQYLMLNRGRPYWAIVKVCCNVRQGKAGLPPAYCPTEPEFNLLIEREVADYERQLTRTQRILEAKVWPLDPPKLTRAEIDARLGRSLSASAPAEVRTTASSDGNHAIRVIADIAARKARSEVLSGPAETGETATKENLTG